MSVTHSTRICVPVIIRTPQELQKKIIEAAAVADVIELRLDFLPVEKHGEILNLISDLIPSVDKEFVITLRTRSQGGECDLNIADQIQFWNSCFAYTASNKNIFFDLEIDLVEKVEKCNLDLRLSKHLWNRVICSDHNFAHMPLSLDQVYERIKRTPARIIKIAWMAADITDSIPVLNLIDRARQEGREIIAIAMGEAGAMTRILGPACGAFMTYAQLDPENRTASGQLSATSLNSLYRLKSLSTKTVVTGLVGYPIGHSVSPNMHNAAFAEVGLGMVYLPFEVKNISEFVARMIAPPTREIKWNLRGLSVTAPHKEEMLRLMHWVDSTAQQIKAVNTVVVEGDKLHGFNTDMEGAIRPLKKLAGDLHGSRVAVIGAGGAARALVCGLRKEGASITIFNRSVNRARILAEEFQVATHILRNAGDLSDTVDAGDAGFGEFDILVNTTPLGTKGSMEDQSPATIEQLQGVRVVYDFVYNPIETKLIKQARRAGCQTLGGLEMLVEQAAAQFRLWTGQNAPLHIMNEAARAVLLEISDLENK